MSTLTCRRPLALAAVIAICAWSQYFTCGAHAADKPSAKAGHNRTAAEPAKDAAAAVRQTAVAFQEAFNRGDSRALAALWAEDGDYVDDEGQRFAGREAIQQEYAAFFAEHPGAKITILVDSVRLLGADTALEEGRVVSDPPPPGPPGTNKYVAVHVRSDGRWLMSTVRDTRVPTPSAYAHVQDLEWMIGSWTAAEQGAVLKIDCRWIANKSYVQRSYEVIRDNQVVSSGIQIVGWDPQAGAIRSWMFAADGGYATGTWAPRTGGWAVNFSGVSADGTPSQAVNIVQRVDDNAVTWRSVDRMLGGQRLPDQPEVLIRRDTAQK